MTDTRRLLYKIAPFIQSDSVTEAQYIELDTSTFSGNLSSSTDTLQKLAESVDTLATPSSSLQFTSTDDSYTGLLSSGSISTERFVTFTTVGTPTNSSLNADTTRVDISTTGLYNVNMNLVVLNTFGTSNSRLIPDVSIYVNNVLQSRENHYIRSTTASGDPGLAPNSMRFDVEFTNTLNVGDVIRVGLRARTGSVSTSAQVTTSTLTVRRINATGVVQGNIPEVGAFSVDIAPRVDLNTTLTGTRTVRFRAYNPQLITSLSLFIEEDGLFQTHALTVPTSSGTQTQTVTISSLNTNVEKTLVFYLIVNGNLVSSSYIVRVENIEGSDVVIDRTNLNTVQGTTAQDMATELERLFDTVSRVQNEITASNRPLNTFDSSVTINAGNLGDFINRNNIYVASTDQRVNFVPPAESVLTGQYPVTFEISHFGGTQRFDTGINPNNTIRITRPSDYSSTDTSTFLRRNSETGTNIVFSELHRGDTAILTKEDVNSPWVVVEGSTDPRSSILPNGVFNLNSRGIGFGLNQNGDNFISGLTLYTPNQGDAFVVTGTGITEASTFGRDINTDDVLVAKVDSPSVVLTPTNDDWLIIRDAGNGDLTLTELRFLAQISETDTNVDSRLISRSDVNEVNIWLSTGELDHAPFLNPSTDTDNPQGDGVSYLGGREDRGSDNEFEHNANLSSNLLYIDIDGPITINEHINDIFLVHKDIDGNEIDRHNLGTDFRTITLTGSGDTYYVYDDVGASNNFSGFNYISGQTLEIVITTTNRRFNLNNNINVLPAIADGSIVLSKLEANVQALIQADHSLSASDRAKLDGLQANGTPTPWTAGDLYVKDNDLSGDLAHYFNVGQQNGILAGFEGTRNVTFVVPTFVTATQLQRTDNTAIKNPITRLGVVTLNDQNANPAITLTGIAYTSTLPQSSFNINNPVGDAWQVDGTAANLELTGADDSFKIREANLSQEVRDLFNSQSTTYTLPDNLQSLSNDLTINTRTESGWRTLSNPIRSDLSRQFACLWSSDIRNGVVQEFDDITGVQFTGGAGNNRFYYSDPNDRNNTSFPGAQAYLLNTPLRITNVTGNTPISNSFRKVIAFDYALERELSRQLGVDETVDMVRLGTSSSTPLMGLASEEGLFLNIGRGDGGQRSRTYQVPLQILGGHLHDQIDQITSAETEVIIPSNLSGSLTVTINVQLDNNGVNEGTHSETITITNVGADQTIGSRTFNFTGYPSISAPIRYEHNNTDGTTARRVLFLPWADPFNNAALTYNVTATHSVTETWNVSTTYARRPINAGNSHDDFGLFDPHLWNTEQVHERNRVIFLLQKYRESDSSSDPEMAVKVIVDGEREGSASDSYVIRLHRPASDFIFNDINIGNFISAVSHIQCYDYDEGTNGELVPSITELMTLYNAADRWFGAFTDQDFRTDAFVLGADLELAQGEFFIIRSANGTRYRITVENDGTLDTNEIT